MVGQCEVWFGKSLSAFLSGLKGTGICAMFCSPLKENIASARAMRVGVFF